MRVLEACRGQRTDGPPILRPVSGKPVDRRDVYRMAARSAAAAGIPRHISPLPTPRRDHQRPDAQIPARRADPRTTERYDRARATSTGTASTSSLPTSPACEGVGPGAAPVVVPGVGRRYGVGRTPVTRVRWIYENQINHSNFGNMSG